MLRLLLPALRALPAAAMHRCYTLDVAAPLLRSQAFIDGNWVSADSDFPVLDPATGSELARVSDCGPAEAKQAVDAAFRAFHSWKRVTAKVRQNRNSAGRTETLNSVRRRHRDNRATCRVNM